MKVMAIVIASLETDSYFQFHIIIVKKIRSSSILNLILYTVWYLVYIFPYNLNLMHYFLYNKNLMNVITLLTTYRIKKNCKSTQSGQMSDL